MSYISQVIRVNRGRNPIKIVLALILIAPIAILSYILLKLEQFSAWVNEDFLIDFGHNILDWAMTRKL
jgi:hypothetical protein